MSYIKPVFFKLANSNVHHKRNQLIPIVILSWELGYNLFLSKTIDPHFQPFKVGQRVLFGRHGNHIVRLAGVDGPPGNCCFNLGG